MKKALIFMFLVFGVFSLFALDGYPPDYRTINDEDSRTLIKISESVGISFPKEFVEIDKEAGVWRPKHNQTLNERFANLYGQPLCEGHVNYSDPYLGINEEGVCRHVTSTGFVVKNPKDGKKYFLTTKGIFQETCENRLVVFNFQSNEDGNIDYNLNNVYECKKVFSFGPEWLGTDAVFEEDVAPDGKRDIRDDYILLELDREINVDAVRLESNLENIKTNAPVVTIHHPLSSAKLFSGGVDYSWITNLDKRTIVGENESTLIGFGHNIFFLNQRSFGAPVINPDSGKVIGFIAEGGKKSDSIGGDLYSLCPTRDNPEYNLKDGKFFGLKCPNGDCSDNCFYLRARDYMEGENPIALVFHDVDNDGIINIFDNCPYKYNSGQEDKDNDLVGDVCDNCQNIPNQNQRNSDKLGITGFGDSYGDACDNCPYIRNEDQADFDNDGTGNACDTDWDGDGILNEIDNCPHIWNPSQQDSEKPHGDGVGDVCDACPYSYDAAPVANYKPLIMPFYKELIQQTYRDFEDVRDIPIDSDLDGVPDACDNCPHVPNPRIGVTPRRELFLAPCDPKIPGTCEAGSSVMETTQNGGKIFTIGSWVLVPEVNWTTKKYNYKYVYVNTPFYAWQSDLDLDGIGDVCDYSGGENGIDRSNNPGTSTARILNMGPVRTTVKAPNGNVSKVRENSLYMLELASAEWNRANNPDTVILKNTVHFCGMPKEEYINEDLNIINWGNSGFCTNGMTSVNGDFVELEFNPSPNVVWKNSKNVNFGYSHGTDPAVEDANIQDYKPWTHIAWKRTQSDAEKITADKEILNAARIPVKINTKEKGAICVDALEKSGKGCVIYPYWNWRMDAIDYMDCVLKDFALCSQLENDFVPENEMPEIFHFSLSAGALGIDEKNYILDTQEGRKINPDYFHNIRKYARSFRNSIKDAGVGIFVHDFAHFSLIFPSVFLNSHQPVIDPAQNKIAHWQISDKGFRLMNKSLPENYTALASGSFNTLYSVTRDEDGNRVLNINFSDETNDWDTVSIIPDWPAELKLRGIDVVGDSLYFAGLDAQEYGSPFRIYRFNMNPAVMATTVVHELETPLFQVRFIELNGEMYMSGIKEGSLSIYSFDKNTIIEKAQLPVRIDYTITVDGSSVYIAGGKNENEMQYSDILVLRDGGTNWETFADLSNYQMNLSKSFVHFSGGRMFIINPDADVDSNVKKVASIDLETGETVVEMTVPDGISFEYDSNLCVYENNGSIFPGSIGYDGGCIPVYNYNYQTVSYLDYKYTVAGFGSNLYLGGLTGVRRVEIRNDGSLVNSDMLYTGETNNLAVYGSTMYGANYGEIDVYLIADSGSISRTRGISSSSCGNVRVYDDKLFTAENKRVRIFDLTDPQNPLLVKTIATSGKVIDLEVVGEKLYIYEETTSWFTTKGFTGIYDISNLNSPVRTKYFEKICTDAEMQRSGNNSKGSLDEKVYLGCKNGQHRVTDTGLVSVSGEKNYVREGYLYDKVLYQVFSGALHRSKAAPFFSVCGNGIIEPGETCDGNFAQCTDVSSSYISGIAACNSTCDGYNTSACETDGW